MTYIDGMVAAVPNANKQAFIAHAKDMAKVFKKHGALHVFENWGVEVPDGKLTSFPMAVKRQDDETVVFSWIVWPSKEVHAAAWDSIMADETMSPANMPFDGNRMIYGQFETVLEA
jgi:uncharacterized protein YbaA (DUF1428 family)